jgi:transcriptional regulator with XRE-family HTH domain
MPKLSRLNPRKPEDTKFLKSIANNLRRARERKGYSQEQLAQMAGFSRSYYNEIELGKRNISILNLYKLMSALELTANELFDINDKDMHSSNLK